jgi:predicted LPLAT superfamily acyltransferase
MAEKQWEGKSYGTPLGYRIFIFFFKYLGLRFAYLNLTYVVLFFVIKCRKERKAIWFYYRQILKYGVLKSSLKIYLHFFVFAQTIVDKVAIRYGFSHKFKYTFENAEQAIELMSKPQGAIFMGAHIGSWEVGSHIFSKYDKTMNILMVDAEYQRIKNVIEKSGENPGYKIIPINEDSIEAILRVKKALADGEILGIQGDRYIDEKRKREVEFLGRKADFPEGPFLMASKLRTPVVIYFAMREKMSYNFIFKYVDNKEGLSAKDYQEKIFNEYLKLLEETVKRYPQQWFNFYSFWK